MSLAIIVVSNITWEQKGFCYSRKSSKFLQRESELIILSGHPFAGDRVTSVSTDLEKFIPINKTDIWKSGYGQDRECCKAGSGEGIPGIVPS